MLTMRSRASSICQFFILLGFASCFSTSGLCAQGEPGGPKPEPDVLILVNGEKLIGHFVRSNATSVTFKSEMAGQITVDWAKVKELHSAQRLAVIEKNVKLGKHESTTSIPQGIVSMADQTLNVQVPGAPTPVEIPVANTDHVIDETTFERVALYTPGPFEAWKGTVTGGLNLVSATQQNRSFNGAVNLVRAVPSEEWLAARHRTTVNFNGSYGILTQPATPNVKTEIYHANVEHDEYFTSRLYAFGDIAYDHNFSQGLDLQQDYGAGIGWTVVKTPSRELDVKGSVNYVKQQFQNADVSPNGTPILVENQNLIASTFAQTMRRTFAHNVIFSQQFSVTATWNNLNAYAAAGNATLTMPVYKRIHFTVGMLDTFINNPPPGFRKNSFQLTTGLTYALQ